jgi:hypothetical protein
MEIIMGIILGTLGVAIVGVGAYFAKKILTTNNENNNNNATTTEREEANVQAVTEPSQQPRTNAVTTEREESSVQAVTEPSKPRRLADLSEEEFQKLRESLKLQREEEYKRKVGELDVISLKEEESRREREQQAKIAEAERFIKEELVKADDFAMTLQRVDNLVRRMDEQSKLLQPLVSALETIMRERNANAANRQSQSLAEEKASDEKSVVYRPHIDEKGGHYRH